MSQNVFAMFCFDIKQAALVMKYTNAWQPYPARNCAKVSDTRRNASVRVNQLTT